MPPVLAPDALSTAGIQPAEALPRRAITLAQALREHDELPDADRAAQVVRCLDETTAGLADSAADGSRLPALQARLGAGDALVVFGLQDDELLACVVRRGRVQVFRRLARWREVQTAWRLARFQLDALHHGAGPPPAHLPKMAKRTQARLQTLHELVWAPLADTLTDARRLLLLPTAGLAGLPFAALHDGLTGLAQRHVLAEVSSLGTALRGLQVPCGPLRVELAEPLAGLVHALLATDASRLLARRWPVDDAVNTAFMVRFNCEMARGRTPAEALAEAQAGLMVNHPHPAYWAGFVLYGGW